MTGQKRQLIIAGICAALAMIAVFAYTATVKSEASIQRAAAVQNYGGDKVEVVVAKSDIPAGQIIDNSMLELVKTPVDLLPGSEVATSLDQVSGKVAAIDFKSNEPILLERVGDGSSRINVPAGLEAVSISSDDVLAVGGAIQTGSFVDVYVETSTGSIVELGRNILVLETSTSSDDDEKAENITWVTLAVTQDSVSELISAATKGTVHLALPGDQNSASSTSANASQKQEDTQ